MILDHNGRELKKDPVRCPRCDSTQTVETKSFGGYVTVNCQKCGTRISRERES